MPARLMTVRPCKLTWAAQWIETLVRLQNPTTMPQRRAWFDRQLENLEDFVRRELLAAGESKCSLANAQFIIARVHGFKSWPRFAKYVESLTQTSSSLSKFESAAEAVISGDVAALQHLLRENPELVHARSTREHQATLLQYVAGNGVESFRQKVPKNAIEVAKILLEAGAEVDAPNWPEGPAGPGTALGEVATSIHTKRAGLQNELLDMLLTYGGSIDGLPRGWNPLMAALHNDSPDAAVFLAAAARISPRSPNARHFRRRQRPIGKHGFGCLMRSRQEDRPPLSKPPWPGLKRVHRRA